MSNGNMSWRAEWWTREKQMTVWDTGSHSITYLYLKYVLKCIKWVVITRIQPLSGYHTRLLLRSELQSLFQFISLWLWANPASGYLPATGSVPFMPKHARVPGRRELSGIARRQGNLGGDFIRTGSAGGKELLLRCCPYKTSGLFQHSLPILAQLIQMTAFLWWRIGSDDYPCP